MPHELTAKKQNKTEHLAIKSVKKLKGFLFFFK